MDSTRRENRILRVAVALLAGALLADVVTTGQQTQRLPGPGSGIVDVEVVKEAQVAAAQRGDWRVAQQGDWRVAQQGDWRVAQQGDWRVQGTVATLPSMPRFIKVGGVYAVRGPSLEMVATVRELHESGWALVSDEMRQEHWINVAAMSSVRVR